MRPTVLVVSQVYVPDPAAVGQHVADAAAELVTRGWRVVVLTASRGYEDASRRYARREVVEGVEVVRLPFSSFGKGSIAIRLIAQSLFLIQAACRALFVRGVACVLVSTSPPMASAVGWAIAALRRVPFELWMMDLNPDQIVAVGAMRPDALAARMFDALNRFALRRARHVVVLDRYMAERVNRKIDVSQKLEVIPPWPLEDHVGRAPKRGDAFREAHRLRGKFVVMYSGNHSPFNPLRTLLEAARRLVEDERFVFVFVGSGAAKRDVERAIAEGVRNVRSLPYQPLDSLGESLSAADVHVASIGDALVGIVHPCKVYGAMRVGRPLLTFGPRHCHLADLVERLRIGHHVAHGDVAGAVAALLHLAALPAEERAAIRRRAREHIARELSQQALRSRFCRVLERDAVARGMEPRQAGEAHAGAGRPLDV